MYVDGDAETVSGDEKNRNAGRDEKKNYWYNSFFISSRLSLMIER